MYQLCLHSSVVMLFKTYGFSGCPCACIWAPRKFSSRVRPGVMYCRVPVKTCPGSLSGDTFYMSSTLIKVMPFILWRPIIMIISLYWGGAIETHGRWTLNFFQRYKVKPVGLVWVKFSFIRKGSFLCKQVVLFLNDAFGSWKCPSYFRKKLIGLFVP